VRFLVLVDPGHRRPFRNRQGFRQELEVLDVDFGRVRGDRLGLLSDGADCADRHQDHRSRDRFSEAFEHSRSPS
jgi:hypothetical protein